MLKLLVFGDVEDDSPESKAEEGRASRNQSPSTNQNSELTTLQYVGRLAMCIAGLQGAYLTWGVLQVRGGVCGSSGSVSHGGVSYRWEGHILVTSYIGCLTGGVCGSPGEHILHGCVWGHYRSREHLRGGVLQRLHQGRGVN
jgi:hypothetical protein